MQSSCGHLNFFGKSQRCFNRVGNHRMLAAYKASIVSTWGFQPRVGYGIFTLGDCCVRLLRRLARCKGYKEMPRTSRAYEGLDRRHGSGESYAAISNESTGSGFSARRLSGIVTLARTLQEMRTVRAERALSHAAHVPTKSSGSLTPFWMANLATKGCQRHGTPFFRHLYTVSRPIFLPDSAEIFSASSRGLPSWFKKVSCCAMAQQSDF